MRGGFALSSILPLTPNTLFFLKFPIDADGRDDGISVDPCHSRRQLSLPCEACAPEVVRMVSILKLNCPDVGLLAQVTSAISNHGGNLLEVSQYR
jgi:hypothetical protein